MNELFPPTSRRTVLQRSLAFAAGVVGVKLATPDTRAEAPLEAAPPLPPPAAPAPRNSSETLTVYARRLRVHNASPKPGHQSAGSGKLSSRSDLLESPNGAKVGELSATCFGPDSPFGCGGTDQSVELQTLRLNDGTLFGIGSSGPTTQGERGHAIVGGTGRFAGSKGSYVIRQNQTGRGDENVQIVITFII